MIFFKTLTIRAWGERGQPCYYFPNKMISFIGRLAKKTPSLATRGFSYSDLLCVMTVTFTWTTYTLACFLTQDVVRVLKVFAGACTLFSHCLTFLLLELHDEVLDSVRTVLFRVDCCLDGRTNQVLSCHEQRCVVDA